MIFSLAPKRLTMLSSIALLSLALMAVGPSRAGPDSRFKADLEGRRRELRCKAEATRGVRRRLLTLEETNHRVFGKRNQLLPCPGVEQELPPEPEESRRSYVEESKLQGVASIDFDSLAMNSKTVLTKLMTKMFSGIHTLAVRGKLVTAEGKARFELEEAHFDDSALPSFLVEEIISAVGRKQKPPFDPMQPSKLPYGIQTVELHPGRALVRSVESQ